MGAQASTSGDGDPDLLVTNDFGFLLGPTEPGRTTGSAGSPSGAGARQRRALRHGHGGRI
jgi:hypothetical protein